MTSVGTLTEYVPEKIEISDPQPTLEAKVTPVAGGAPIPNLIGKKVDFKKDANNSFSGEVTAHPGNTIKIKYNLQGTIELGDYVVQISIADPVKNKKANIPTVDGVIEVIA